MESARIGILTGGGDCPGLNAVIRASVRHAVQSNLFVLGVKFGWQGLIEGDVEPLTRNSVAGIQYKGGTILGTSRANPVTSDEAIAKIQNNWRKYGLSALIVVGGNGTLGAALVMHRDHGYPVVGVPKTIDNDICATDLSFGFDTAVSIATDAIDRLHTTAESHHRIMVVEVMGRHTGWIAAYSGIAGAADCILVPEVPFRISVVAEMMQRRREMGRPFSIIVVAEDARPHPDEDFLTEAQKAVVYREHRLGGIGHLVAARIEKLTGIEARETVLGYVQRGGTPTAFDRVLATRYGVYAVDMVLAKKWGRMASLSSNSIVDVPLEDAVARFKTLDPEIYKTAETLFG